MGISYEAKYKEKSVYNRPDNDRLCIKPRLKNSD